MANDPENRQWISDADIETAVSHADQFSDKIEKGLHYGKFPDVMYSYFKLADGKELQKYADIVSDKLASINEEKLTPKTAKEYYDQITEAEKTGHTKYLDPGDIRDFKETLQDAMKLSTEPVQNWDQVTPKTYTAPRMALPR
jgi:lipoate-protein ligase A